MLTAAERVSLPRYLRLILAQPKNELMVHFPVSMDDGSYRLFKGYRVQHNNILGPYKGGIRYHPSVSLDDVKALAVIMTMKCSLARLPLGSAKGGVQVDPKLLSRGELQRMTRRFASAIANDIGPEYDIPAPDVGTQAQTMAWFADTYMNLQDPRKRQAGLGVVTGKPLEFGGSEGRDSATGQGLVYVLDRMLPDLGLAPETTSFSTLGYGNVGSWTARLLCQRGAKLKAAMDHTGAIHNDRGLDAELLTEHVTRQGGVVGFAQSTPLTPEDFYRLPVDLFIPAALEQMIDADKAELLRCKVLVEGANAPTTPAAERRLIERGVTILPAILCNAGGVTVSYAEWKQNRQSESWPVSRVDGMLREHMTQAADRVRDAAARFKCDLRTAAYCAALENIARTYAVRGIFP